MLIGTTALLSVFWVVRCTFYVDPDLFNGWKQERIDVTAKVCSDVDDRAIATLTSLVATLLAWSSTHHPPS